jgi:alpha-mannosidase
MRRFWIIKLNHRPRLAGPSTGRSARSPIAAWPRRLNGMLRRFIGVPCLVVAMATSSLRAQERASATQPLHPGTLYMVGYSHLDTEWRWTYPTVIAHYLLNTMKDNFALFEKYPHYIFNWTGANRYRLMKEYYPAEFAKVKQYVAAGRWFPAGSSWEESLADEPSAESLVRQVLYGNEFFRKEFGKASVEFMLPDTFGFPASLPTILAHCGLEGFSTQKLTGGWGSAVKIPFNIGKWVGPDGRSIIAVLDAGSYTTKVTSDPTTNPSWTKRVETNGALDGVYIDYRYYGVGDRGGAPDEKSVRNVEAALTDNGPIKVISATAGQMFDDLTPQQIAAMPTCRGDFLLTNHSAGVATSQSFQKWLNRKNELLADDAERASVAANLLGAAVYPREKLTDAWHLILAGQFHDLLAGTGLPKAIEYAWNDGMLARNELTAVRNDAVGGICGAMDTRGQGASVVIYNPLSIERDDVVEAEYDVPGPTPTSIEAIDANGRATPAQVISADGLKLRVAFVAHVPSIGFAVYDLRTGTTAAKSELSVTSQSLENQRYLVKLNASGDVASIFDKQAKRELLAAPARLAFLKDFPTKYPAWNVDYVDRTTPPYAHVDGPADVRIVESGPVRVALEVRRSAQNSTFIQTIRLASGDAGNRVEFDTSIDWHTAASSLKATFPLTVSNPMATYNWEAGTIERGNNDPKKYEVPSHQWFDLTDRGGAYGVSVLEDCKYASDKPDDSTLRLTLLRTPGVKGEYADQATQDFGRHHVLYAVEGHAGDWRAGETQWEAMRLNQPLTAFESPQHAGSLGKAISFLSLDTKQVAVRAFKLAEDSDKVILRLQELTGKPAAGVKFIPPDRWTISKIEECDGQERFIADADNSIDMPAYGLRAFAVTLARSGPAEGPPLAAQCQAISLPFNVDVITASPADAATPPATRPSSRFDSEGRTLPAEMIGNQVTSEGIAFQIGAVGAPNAVACGGQTIALPAGSWNRLYLLAASSKGEAHVTLQIDDHPTDLTIQDWSGYIGLTDNRIWKGSEYPEADYQWHNRFAGIAPGFVRLDPVAWYSSHRHASDGVNEIYKYCYLFKYRIDLPANAKTLKLPDDSNVKIMAATVAVNQNDAILAPREKWPWEGIELSQGK